MSDRTGPREGGELEASPLIISQTDTHIVIAIEISKATLRRHRRFLQKEIGLAIIRFLFQDFFDPLHRALRRFLDLTLRFHHRDRRGRNVEEAFLGCFLFGDFGPSQQLPAG